VKWIRSGGQTGVDRAALDWAIHNQIPHGGWCPKGRLAEDGTIPARYCLRETPDAAVEQRTEWNVRDSDGTVIFSIEPELQGGSRTTLDAASRHGKPCLHLCAENPVIACAESLRNFLIENRIEVLNVAGPRHSEEPAAAAFATAVLEECLRSMREKTGPAVCNSPPPV
jgi:hypothetical protein